MVESDGDTDCLLHLFGRENKIKVVPNGASVDYRLRP